MHSMKRDKEPTIEEAPAKKRRKCPTMTQAKKDKLVELRTAGKSEREIARSIDVSPYAVHYWINALKLPTHEEIQSYKENRADILAGLQARIIKSITEADLSKATAYQKVGMYALLYDKERIERGQSTSNVSILTKIIQVADRQETGHDKPAIPSPRPEITPEHVESIKKSKGK